MHCPVVLKDITRNLLKRFVLGTFTKNWRKIQSIFNNMTDISITINNVTMVINIIIVSIIKETQDSNISYLMPIHEFEYVNI